MKNLVKGLIVMLTLVFISAPAYAWPWSKPEFTVSKGEKQIREIMTKNRDSFSPGGSYFFEIKNINYQQRMGKEYCFVVKYDAKASDGCAYDMQRVVLVGKDSEGFYIRTHPDLGKDILIIFR